LKTTQEADAEVVVLADGSRQPCNLYISDLPLKMNKYQNKLTFFVTKLKAYDIVLGKSRLAQYNPMIDWRTNKIEFNQKNNVIKLQAGSKKRQSTRQLNPINAMQLKSIVSKSECELFLIYSDYESLNDLELSQDVVENKDLKRLLEEYEDVFLKDLPSELPPSRNVDHKIEIIPGSTPPS